MGIWWGRLGGSGRVVGWMTEIWERRFLLELLRQLLFQRRILRVVLRIDCGLFGWLRF